MHPVYVFAGLLDVECTGMPVQVNSGFSVITCWVLISPLRPSASDA